MTDDELEVYESFAHKGGTASSTTILGFVASVRSAQADALAHRLRCDQLERRIAVLERASLADVAMIRELKEEKKHLESRIQSQRWELRVMNHQWVTLKAGDTSGIEESLKQEKAAHRRSSRCSEGHFAARKEAEAKVAELQALVDCATSLNMGAGVYVAKTSDGGYYVEWGTRFDEREGFHTLNDALVRARELSKGGDK